MKVTINTTAPQKREIDWSKPMVVQSSSGTIILTTGNHSGDSFSGIRVTDNKEYSANWWKSRFTPCTTPVTITFENEL